MTHAELQHPRTAAEKAVELVRSGMVVGLGTGSAASFAVRKLADNLRTGIVRDIVGVPTSGATEALARELAIPLSTLDERPEIDLTIDGADEVDPDLNLIKGAGGALLREKMLAQASARFVIVVDDSKLVPRLGARRALPVEVVPFGSRAQQRYLERLGAEVALRLDSAGDPFRTDNGNYIFDCRFDSIPQLERLSAELHMRAGIVEHGLFIGLASDVISAGDHGLRHAMRQDRTTGRTT